MWGGVRPFRLQLQILHALPSSLTYETELPSHALFISCSLKLRPRQFGKLVLRIWSFKA